MNTDDAPCTMNRQIRILMVDDDPNVLFAMARIVAAGGYAVETAATGAECLAAMKADPPDLILLDVVLPDANGIALCERIKKDPALKSTFIVLVSSLRTSSDHQADGLDAGADGYLTKPIANRELLARVNAMVRIMTAERERDRLIEELRAALGRVKTLTGLLPICAHCKKIKDTDGAWTHLETYLEAHSDAGMSHGICPECTASVYAELDLKDE